MLDLNLLMLDWLTPKYDCVICNELTSTERKILATLARVNQRTRIRDLVKVMPAPKPQHNVLSMQLRRLHIVKGILNRTKEGYDFNDVWFRLWLRARAGLF